FVVGMKDAAFELVRAEAVLFLQRPGVGGELLRGTHFAAPGAGVAEKEVRRERHAIAQRAAKDVVYRHAPRLAEHVEALELDRGDHEAARRGAIQLARREAIVRRPLADDAIADAHAEVRGAGIDVEILDGEIVRAGRTGVLERRRARLDRALDRARARRG